VLAAISSATLHGVEGHRVCFDVHVANGLPGFTVVGLPDAAVREWRHRVRAAMSSSGLVWLKHRITVNLAPSRYHSGKSARRGRMGECGDGTSRRHNPSYYGSRVMSMPRGRPSPKLAITVDADVHAQVMAAASEEGVSVSAWMTSAARRALLARDGLRGVAEWEAEHGAFTEAELEAARRRIADEKVSTSHSRSP
jgi:hypothetical protein